MKAEFVRCTVVDRFQRRLDDFVPLEACITERKRDATIVNCGPERKMFWQSVQDLEREKGWNERSRNAFEKRQKQQRHKEQWEAVRHKHASKDSGNNIQFSESAKDSIVEDKDEMQLSYLADITPTKHDIIAEPRRCHRCDRIGHTANACPFFTDERDNHSDAGWGDTTPHLQQTQISISVQGEAIECNQRLPEWWIGQQLEISVDDIWFVLGSASGQCCNCLIDTLRQVLPTVVCDVALVRAELERRHAEKSTAILPFEYLDLATYWSDVIDIIGEQNIVARTVGLSSKFRVCCVDMCWIGHGEVLPRDVPANARQTLYIARVNQNHFVPLQCCRKRDREVTLCNTSCFGAGSYKELNVAQKTDNHQAATTQNTGADQRIKYSADDVTKAQKMSKPKDQRLSLIHI